MSNKNYQELIKDRIYFGGADDVKEMMDHENADIVFDLRVKNYEADTEINRVHSPIVDDSEEQANTLKTAIENVVEAYNSDQKVYFHCGGGNTRAGIVAIGTLLALNKAETIDEAEEMALKIRPTIKSNPNMKEALKKIYPKA
ncbi:dual specificity protein phosphatase family protein [Bacillus sp. AFS017336]|uniref:protein-tyrosine phosphatase family protein n=1 Tax=Bacillus sp. AFS017336 TaxID=2033489 RepID=UPI000BEF7142|nr:dual specificity protein phosphatase family protein [Bacillus sp. AFS017336]PEK99102.1 protein tyrosine phosphatase [Bacillus sp. AFS017336]